MKMKVYQNLYNIAKIMLIGKFLLVNSYIMREGRSQINNLIFHLKTLEKQGQTKLETSRSKEIKGQGEN